MLRTVITRCLACSFVFFMAAALSLPARGQLIDDEIVGARAEGMGSAFRALAFDNGKIICDGSAREVLADPAVSEAILGI